MLKIRWKKRKSDYKNNLVTNHCSKATKKLVLQVLQMEHYLSFFFFFSLYFSPMRHYCLFLHHSGGKKHFSSLAAVSFCCKESECHLHLDSFNPGNITHSKI